MNPRYVSATDKSYRDQWAITLKSSSNSTDYTKLRARTQSRSSCVARRNAPIASVVRPASPKAIASSMCAGAESDCSRVRGTRTAIADCVCPLRRCAAPNISRAWGVRGRLSKSRLPALPRGWDLFPAIVQRDQAQRRAFQRPPKRCSIDHPGIPEDRYDAIRSCSGRVVKSSADSRRRQDQRATGAKTDRSKTCCIGACRENDFIAVLQKGARLAAGEANWLRAAA